MPKFLKQAFWTILPFLVIIIGAEVLYTHVPNEYSQKSEIILSPSDSIEIMVFGPSVTLRGINPDMFTLPTYNASLRGLELELDDLVISQAIDKHNDLEFIILSIAFNDFHHKARAYNVSSLVYFSKYFNLDEFRTFIAQERGGKMIKLIWDYYVNDKIQDTGIRSNGFRIFKNTKPIFGKKAQKLAQSLNNQNPDFVSDNRQHLKHIVDKCSTNDIDLIILNTPLHHSMLELLNQDLVDELNLICGDLSRQFDHVHHLNWMDHSAFEDSDFQDPIHLYEHGANKLSVLLNDYIEELPMQ